MAQNKPLADVEGVHLTHDTKDEGRKALPPGAQRLVHQILAHKLPSLDKVFDAYVLNVFCNC